MEFRIWLENDEVQEWIFHGVEWKRGYEDGVIGRPIQVYDDERYRRGWEIGYRKYVCKKRPDLC